MTFIPEQISFSVIMAKNGRKEVEQRKGEEKKEPQIRDEQQEALREKAIKNMAKRPDYGKTGRHTHVLTNYFEVKKVLVFISLA
jgi:glutamate formiminotransferase